MKIFYYVKLLILLLILVVSKVSMAQDTVKNSVVFNHLLEIIEPPSETSKVDVQALLSNLRSSYAQNQLSPELRKKLYKSLLDRTDVKKWPVELKAIVLYKLIDYDTKNKVPAYIVAEDGRTPFFNIINKLIEEEFGFVDELKQKLAEAINQQNIDSNEPGKAPQLIKKEDIELTESQQLEVLQIAYQKLVEKVGSLELFHF